MRETEGRFLLRGQETQEDHGGRRTHALHSNDLGSLVVKGLLSGPYEDLLVKELACVMGRACH